MKTKMKPQQLPINDFAIKSLAKYSKWWHDQVQLINGTPVLQPLQRQYAPDKQLIKKKYNCPREAIPYIEITPLYRKTDKGILFVNCNPSGTDYKYYAANNTKTPTDFFMYNKAGNSYFNAAADFADRVGLKDNYAMIDVFPVVIQNQDILKKAYMKAPEKLRYAFSQLLEIFLNNIVEIQPKVVVATNAFVKDLFTSDDMKNHPFSLRNLKLLDDFEDKGELVYYRIVIKGFETHLFCGGMIAGGHQMDTESKERLIRDVGLFLNHKSIKF